MSDEDFQKIYERYGECVTELVDSLDHCLDRNEKTEEVQEILELAKRLE